MIISAAPINKCQKLGTYKQQHVSFCGECREDFAFINFKIFPNSMVIPHEPLAGGTININFRCCLLTHTFFNFLFPLFIMLFCASCLACM